MRVLELFSGTGSVKKVGIKLGYEVISLDLTDATICCDILNWNYKEAFSVGYFDIIWASPPCNTFSKMRLSNIGRYGITMESIQQDISNIGLPILRRTEEIIDYFKPSLYFIENPQTGRMKDYIDRPYYDVDYCKYSDWGMRKRTRIWTNKVGFEPKVCNKDCGFIKDGRHIRCAAGGNKNTKGQGGGDKKLRYRIPPMLIEELFELFAIELFKHSK